MADEPKPPRKLVFSSATPMAAGSLLQPPPVPGAHVHGPGCGHDHDHDHHHHDHDHDHVRQERPPTDRPCGGEEAFQLDLAFFLPGETDDLGRFEQVQRELGRFGGVRSVHRRSDGPHLEICVHLEPGGTSREGLVSEARTRSARAGKRYVSRTWFVRGMDSAQCGYVIEHVLRRTPGILQADVACAAERLVLEYDTAAVSERQIERRIEAMGYALEVPEAGHACSHHAHQGGLAPRLEMPLTLAAGLAIGVGLGLPYLVPVPPALESAVFGVALVCAGFYPARSALTAVRALRLDIEALMVLAAIGAALLGAWFEGAFLLFLFSLGHSLEHRAMDRARHAVEALGKLRPETARVRRGDDLVEVPVGQVRRGDVIVVRPGDRVPLDGLVRAGQSHIDQAAITGESVPVPKGPGDPVYAGTMNADGALDVTITKLSSESALARIVDLVAESEARKSRAQRFTARIERIFVPIVLFGAPLLSVGLWATGTGLEQAVLRGLSVLVAASPCALAISTPAAVLSAVARAARDGVLIKGGAHLEALGEIRVVAFDKTGTLTEGRPRLLDVIPLGIGERELLGMAAGAEELLSHPIAAAVVRGARERGIAPESAEDAEAVHGRGVRATVGGRSVEIGNEELFSTVPPEVASQVGELRGRGQTAMIVAVDGAFVGVLGVADTVRLEARPAVARLREIGVERTVMLSGDHGLVARAVATELGVDEHRAPLLPEGKVRALKDLMREGAVAMVGDGVNDAPALSAATIGIAMGGAGSDVALETADVVLMGDDLHKLPFAIRLGRAANAVVRQNIVVSLGVAAVLVVASIAGWVQISHAVVLHEGSTLVVVANGLRLLGWRGSDR